MLVPTTTSTFVSIIFALTSLTSGKVDANDRAPTGFQFHRRAADVTPTAPGPNDVFKTGTDCEIQWTPGTGSNWSKMTIDFMTGANQNMKKLTNVASNLDGTDASTTSYKWTCPEVDPYSAIYFYQFTDQDGVNPAWTTRFAISDENGKTTTPPNSKQPKTNEAIAWGNGKIVSGGGNSSSSSKSSSPNNSEDDSSSSSSPSTNSSQSSSSTTSSLSSTTNNTQDSSSTSGASSFPLASTALLLTGTFLLSVMTM